MTIAKFADCFAPVTPEFAKALKADGYSGVCRYLGAKTHPEWGKGMTPAEVAIIHAAGLSIVSIWEGGGATRADYFTHQQGLIDGAQALEEAKWITQPLGTAIYPSADFDAQEADIPAIRNYLDGVRRSFGTLYKPGVYGGYRVVTSVPADFYWQTAAWSGGRKFPKAALYQDVFNKRVHSVGIDEDQVVRDTGCWPAAKTTPTQPKKGADKKMTLPNDVKPGTWDSVAVQKMISIGAMGAFSDGSFRPDEAMTRGQTAVFGANLLKQFNATISAINTAQHASQQPALPAWLKQTVMINVFGTPADQEAWWGAGVWIDPETILTAHHVTHSKNLQQEIDPTRFHLHAADGVQIQGDSTWTITPHPSGWDLAVIKTTGTGRGAHLNFDTPSPGEDCWTIGYPQAIPFYVSRGVVSTDHMPSVGEGPTFGVAIFGYEGNSGGPIFNAAGNLLGILVQGTLVPVGTAGVVDNFQIVAVPAWRP